MKQRVFCMLCAALVLLSACGKKPEEPEKEARLTVLTATYPLYTVAGTLTEGVDGVEVERLATGNISCLHDYTLSVGDMKMIEGADLIALNGVGLEGFMEDALASAKAPVIDTSQGVELLEALSHHHGEGEEHDHGHYDPHIWLDPDNLIVMARNLEKGLAQADPDHADRYSQNLAALESTVEAWEDRMEEQLDALRPTVEFSGLITFHDGFQYFADAFDLPLLAAIEEEAGSEASAKEINAITALVKERSIPVIFTEKNGSDATAKAIARETGCAVAQLDMLMSGEGRYVQDYLDGLSADLTAVINGFAGSEVSVTTPGE